MRLSDPDARTAVAAVVGLLLALPLWGVAASTPCGISGCGGGGSGRSSDPGSVLVLLLLSGAAAAPLAMARRGGVPRLRVVVGVLLLVPVAGGLLIDARPDGYPRSVPSETIQRELAD